MRIEQGELEIKLRGVVVPMAWDERGNVVGIALSTHDEHEYAIDKDIKGEELLSLIRKEILVTGIVTEKDNKKILKIVNYSVKRARAPEESLTKEKSSPAKTSRKRKR